MRQTLIAGNMVYEIGRALENGWYMGIIPDRMLIVRPEACPFYILEESDVHPYKYSLWLYHSRFNKPQPILAELTKTGDRQAILATLKQFVPQDNTVIEVDLLELALKHVQENPVSPLELDPESTPPLPWRGNGTTNPQIGN